MKLSNKKPFCTLFSLLLTIIIILTAGKLSAGYSADAIAFSNSYSLRATATEANYWNPANLVFPLQTKGEFLIFNTHLNVGNNLLSIRKYNELNGRYLSQRNKKDIIDDLGKGLLVNADFNHTVGIAMADFALNWRLNFHTKGRLSSEYIKLLLYGNEYDHIYKFDGKNNSFDLLFYSDLTYGRSFQTLNIYGYDIHTGYAISFLNGFRVMETSEYQSKLHISDDGINFTQNIEVRSGKSGVGLKSLIGFRNDFNDDLSFSLTIDNVLGFIRWMGDTEKSVYTASVENVYISSLDEIIIDSADTTQTIGRFTTILHPSFRMGTLYRTQTVSYSVDWKQGFTNSVLTSKTPELGMGIEITHYPAVPLRLGFSPGLGNNPYSVSYGVATNIRELEMSLGVKSVRAIIPSSFSRGISVALTSKWSF